MDIFPICNYHIISNRNAHPKYKLMYISAA